MKLARGTENGSGGASLGYLRQLTVDAIKIDRSFTAGLGADPSLTLLTSAVIGLAAETQGRG